MAIFMRSKPRGLTSEGTSGVNARENQGTYNSTSNGSPILLIKGCREKVTLSFLPSFHWPIQRYQLETSASGSNKGLP